MSLKAGDYLNKGKFFTALKIFTAVLMSIVAMFCLVVRVPQCFKSSDGAVLAAAALTLSEGEILNDNKLDSQTNTEETTTTKPMTTPVEETTSNVTQINDAQRNWDDYYNSYADHDGEDKYDVTEKQYTDGGEQFDNFFVKNKTNYSLNIENELNSPLGFQMDDSSDEIQVLIMHTHTCESYLDADTGYFFSSFYPRTTNSEFNVTQVGDAITSELKQAGIGVIHDTTIHDYPSYNGSYDRSLETINSYLEKYPSIKVIFDIHRDAIGTETNKIKPTFSYDGKKGAQIMIMSGYDEDGSLEFPQWKENLSFALKLQSTSETMFPGITRPMDFGNFAYNMNVNNGSLLVEFGTDGNTLDEAVYSGKLFGKALSKVLQS